ncbi:MAG: hypothetical protein QGF00_12770 [Planctomycetota bacterium]|nr:hypothetical protein [Planctomycetota bacterium]
MAVSIANSARFLKRGGRICTRNYQDSGERWNSQRMLLLTLNQMERDLYKWFC